MCVSKGRGFHVEGRASVKGLRQECVWYVLSISKEDSVSAAGELRTQVLGSEIRGVTAARREGLAGLVRTLTFTVGVRWWG